MAKQNGDKRPRGDTDEKEKKERLHPDTKKSVAAIILIGASIVLTLAALEKAGPAGTWLYGILEALFGWGYFILPLSCFLVALVFLASERKQVMGITLFGAGLLILSVLGLIELMATGRGGWLGLVLGSLQSPFGQIAAFVINVSILAVAILITTNVPLKIKFPKREKTEKPALPETNEMKEREEKAVSAAINAGGVEGASAAVKSEGLTTGALGRRKERPVTPIFQDKNYVAPPLSLLKSNVEKPTTGDLRANANIIKRTLDSFGIPVEMNEINIGPTVTRYTLKPAEGVKLSRIMALNQDLSLALAAHPIRIEAPIPGKSLVGIEVPNKTAAVVRLGSLMSYPEFQGSGTLGFALGRDVNGEPMFPDIDRMPHLLIAGATGSGKSVAIHSLIISLLYKNSPAILKLILVDPKRVELSVYEGLPHLISPVITENKKTVNVLRWAIKEMERRYDVFLAAGKRDIRGYNKDNAAEPLPYLLIVVDELADLMTTYGREVEGSIIRLAQMARATGLHLVLSTQRPSVEVITGLIKANITSRIALQVASQIDSRTILDTTGAEKLLGHGDLLFISSEFSKPKRIQGAYISEEEVHAVADFIRDNNEAATTIEPTTFANGGNGESPEEFSEYLEDEEDELYDEAVEVVAQAKKASASLLQRRLKVGYARAARLLDLMEMNGVVGPGDGAKPREVFVDKIQEK